MIGTLRKHSKSLWWIVIVATIITFVWFFNPSSRTNSGQRAGNYGTMNGVELTSAMLDNARREVLLYHLFATGNFPGPGRTLQGFDVDRETYNRLLVILKAQEMGIQVSDEAAGKAASDRLRMIGRGNPVPIAAFETQVLSREHLTLTDFERFVRNELAIQELISLVGMGGQLIPPQEVEALYRRDHQELSAQAVFFHASNYLASITVTPEKLGEFYTNQAARYRLPERAQVSYVRFPISNFMAQAQQELAQVTNLNELLEARLEELGTNFVTLGATPEAAKAKMKDEFLKGTAFKSANDEAKKFDNQLFDSKEPVTPELFAKLAEAAGLKPEVTAPFTRDEAPAGLDVGRDFARTAFALTAEDPICESVHGQESVYVIAYHHHLPSEQPGFESVRARVTEDYRFYESAMKARQVGIDFQASATNDLAAGKSFADVCAKAGVKPINLSPFSLSSTNVPEVRYQLDLSTLKQVAFATAPGQVGQVLPSADGVGVVYVQSKLPIDENKMRANLPAFTRDVHQVRRSEVFNEWFRREAGQAFNTVTFFQRQKQTPGTPAN